MLLQAKVLGILEIGVLSVIASKHITLDTPISRMYLEGKSIYGIARILGIGHSAVEYRLKINNVPMRSISESLVGRPKSEAHRASLSESKIKSGVAKGSRNPNWRGGITSEAELIRKSREYEIWRRAVYERDSYTCQLCGFDKGGVLEAHHIKPRAKYPNLILAIDNGMTLCKCCHQKIHSKEWTKFHWGELLETLTVKTQTISSRACANRKVQRLCTPPERDDIVSSL